VELEQISLSSELARVRVRLPSYAVCFCLDR